MNKQRRAIIDKIISAVNGIETDLEEVKQSEAEAFDALSEGLQQTEQGQRIQQAAEALERAYDAWTELLSALEEAVEL